MKTTLRSNDLSCPSCIGRIETALSGMDGVESAKVRFNSGRILIEHDEQRAPAEALVKMVRAAGYESAVSRY